MTETPMSIKLVKARLIQNIANAEKDLDEAWKKYRKEAEQAWRWNRPLPPDDETVRSAYLNLQKLKLELADWIMENEL